MSDKSLEANHDQSPIPNPKSHRDWWRTLDERLDDPGFAEKLHNEFPSLLPDEDALADPVARRTFLKLMGASLGLAGVTACTRQPVETIVPYVRQPEQVIPGKPLFFATAMAIGGVATGLLVESHEGRPTKIEGNPSHPGSLGASDIFAQAAVLDLYDPDRVQTLTSLGEIRPWSAFLGAIRAALVAQKPLNGAGLRILTESVSSPTLAAQIRDLLSRYPGAKWHQWDPASRNHAREGARMAFGEYVDVHYRLDRADVVLALDADFLASGAASLRYARAFAARRKPEQHERMNRLYAVETMPSATGSRADHRLPAKPSEIVSIASAIAAAVGVRVGGGPGRAGRAEKWIAAVAKDLQAHRGTSLVIAGDDQPAAVHAIAHAINDALGNAGSTVVVTQPVEAEPVNQLDSLKALTADMNAGKVDILVLVGGNPVYTAPADVPFGDALRNVQQLRAHLTLHANETSALCDWQIPQAHFLETWSDARGFDGTASIVQPLIAPLYGGKSAHDVIASMSDKPERSAYDIVREYWKVDPKNDAAWRKWLHDGVIPNTAFGPKSVKLSAFASQLAAGSAPTGFEVSFKNDPTVLDGRFSNNGWLQELPKPITKLTWDNAVIVSPATAEKLKAGASPAMTGGEHGQIVADVIEITFKGRSVQGPILAVVGHPDDCITVHAGYGRARGGQLAVGPGFSANAIRTSDAYSSGSGAEVKLAGSTHSLAITQYHHLIEGRGIIRAATREEYAKNPKSVHEGAGVEEAPGKTITLYPDWKYEGHRWGMAIDVNACIGCNACVVGCQSENNIPVVGKAEVLKGREMHWLRIDSYYRGPAENPETYFQPVPCMQCENAPCEVVCPVGATVHSHEGLNDMVYNRCVGTRYCSNNCPYKVRRFNFLLYQDWNTPSLKLGRNPNVSVRSRGVMEKCTYCVQRINAAKIESEKHDRPIKDGEIVTACQQACPADAIVFGDLNDPASRVAALRAEERNYALLAELNTRPRTTYLAAVRNVNPEIGEA